MTMAESAGPAPRKFQVRFWGVRGTIPCPGPDTLRYGGNTSCIEVICGERHLVFDAGTGIRELGKFYSAKGCAVDAHIFLTHTHIDHINGLPFFRPAYSSENCFSLWAGHLLAQGQAIKPVLQQLMAAPFFPVPLDGMQAAWSFHDFRAGEVLRPHEGIALHTLPLNHPGGATAYRIEFDGRAVAIVTDTEHVRGRPDQSIIEFISGCEFMVYDSTYTDEIFPRFKGWGHSTWQEGVRLCKAAAVPRLVTFHHDPDNGDDDLDRIGELAHQSLPGALVAREGMILDV